MLTDGVALSFSIAPAPLPTEPGFDQDLAAGRAVAPVQRAPRDGCEVLL